jgi:hypothetical protein
MGARAHPSPAPTLAFVRTPWRIVLSIWLTTRRGGCNFGVRYLLSRQEILGVVERAGKIVPPRNVRVNSNN